MRVVVIGAGLSGVATAFELAASGHQVDVVDQAKGIATGASFAPPGWWPQAWLAASHPDVQQPDDLTVWQARWQGVRLAMAHPGRARWSWQRLEAARLGQAGPRRALALTLAQRSSRRLRSLASAWDWRLEGGRGAAVVLRDTAAPMRMDLWATRMQAAGVPWRSLDGAALRTHMPLLPEPSTPVHALLMPDEDLTNGRELAHVLKSEAQRLGARFHFDVRLDALAPGPKLQWSRPLEKPVSDSWDAVVLCTGVDGAAWLQRLGVRLPWQVVGGATVTAPLPSRLAEAPAASLALLDAQTGVQLACLGERVRATGPSVLGRLASEAVRRRQWDQLYRALDQWLPGVARTAKAQEWWSTRATLPDALPVVGPLPSAIGAENGIWCNLGHGEAGGTWALGAARALADQLPPPSAKPWGTPAAEPPLDAAQVALLGCGRWVTALR